MTGQIRHRAIVMRRGETARPQERALVAERPIALVHDGGTTAVMMATPTDIEDFAIGFARSEGIIASLADVVDLQVVENDLGVEARLWLKPGLAARIAERRRALAGPSGCGLCGVDSLAAALRKPPRIAGGQTIDGDAIHRALDAMAPLQAIGRATRACHAAALAAGDGTILALREDVGRHNALDKLAGAALRQRLDPSEGFVVVTSRLSVEMIQKAAVLGAPTIVAVSAPTDLALATAEEAGLTVVAIARQDGFEVFTHPERIADCLEVV